ncbi:hypothetical protein M9Y10_027194 [Tritrichomonas musculus]|uniref:Uncharacterized protein n=1 Tax=Tritrichomonas musculus TaxID=1915356 RepID=A0ABR2H5R7_9EUKA
MTTSPNNASRAKKPFVSHYDPSIFYTPMHKAADVPCKPVHNRVKYQIKLTVTLKDIGLEGLDSSSPDKPYQARQREQQRKQEKRSQKSSSPSTSPQIKKQKSA